MPTLLSAAPAFSVTKEMISPVTDAITSSLPVLVPVGIGLMAIMLGVSIIPRVIYKFF